MKKLINYLGNENVIISILENGDSTDKTNEKLSDSNNFIIINIYLILSFKNSK